VRALLPLPVPAYMCRVTQWVGCGNGAVHAFINLISSHWEPVASGVEAWSRCGTSLPTNSQWEAEHVQAPALVYTSTTSILAESGLLHAERATAGVYNYVVPIVAPVAGHNGRSSAISHGKWPTAIQCMGDVRLWHVQDCQQCFVT
jgi:hypothetical protein